MKLRNKKTGEIKSLSIYGIDLHIRDEDMPVYHSLKELNEEWEDVPKKPKEYWYIDCYGTVLRSLNNSNEWDERRKEIGNYFETKEEAEKAAEKLKAFKRLKHKGFRFRWIDMQTGQIKYGLFLEKGQKVTRKDEDDLLLLFGGEE